MGHPERDRVFGRDGACPSDRLHEELGQIDGDVFEWASFVETSEEKEFLDQVVHTARLHSDAVERAFQVLGMTACPAFEQFGVRADRGERGPELMRDVGDEAAHAFFRLAELGFRVIPLLERAVHPVEHRVQGGGDASDLVVDVGAGCPMIELAAVGDRLCRLLDTT